MAVREAGLDPRWDKAAANAGWSLGHGYVMLLSGRGRRRRAVAGNGATVFSVAGGGTDASTAVNVKR